MGAFALLLGNLEVSATPCLTDIGKLVYLAFKLLYDYRMCAHWLPDAVHILTLTFS